MNENPSVVIGPLRCPKCSALIVDRRSRLCTSCQAELPADWVMTPEQVREVEAIDQHARAEHGAVMNDLDAVNTDVELKDSDFGGDAGLV